MTCETLLSTKGRRGLHCTREGVVLLTAARSTRDAIHIASHGYSTKFTRHVCGQHARMWTRSGWRIVLAPKRPPAVKFTPH